MGRGVRKNYLNIYSRGVSIIEALLAAVIVGIGFVSVYTMTTNASRMTFESQSRDRGTMGVSLIFDDLAMDGFSIADSTYHETISSAQYNNVDLTTMCTNQPSGFNANARKRARQMKRWCETESNTWWVDIPTNNPLVFQRGSAPGDERIIYVRDIDITSNGYNQQYKVVGLRIEENS